MVKSQWFHPHCSYCMFGLFGHHYKMNIIKNEISCRCDNCNQEIFHSPSPFSSRIATAHAVMTMNTNTQYDDYISQYLKGEKT